jgi:molybdate transport system permease protein
MQQSINLRNRFAGNSHYKSFATNKKENMFHGIVYSSIIIYVLFVVFVIGSVLIYTDLETLIKSLTSESTLFSIKLSLVTSLISTGLAILIAIPAGYCLSRYEFRGKAILDTIIDLPIVLPPLIVGVCLLIFFSTSFGKFIENNFISFVFEFPGIIIAQFSISASFAIIVLRGAYDSIDPRYEDAARILGCNKSQSFQKVTLPLVRRGIINASIMTWTRAVGEFVPILLLCGAQRGKTTIMPIAIFLQFEVGDIEGAVGLTIIFLLLSVIYLTLLKKFGLSAGFKQVGQ